ncbi:MAG: hypothetical protein K1X29_10640 [Bdellovibrionales bacterium]|nr:hypothetical protein [Bdellovibrionales bacterium]
MIFLFRFLFILLLGFHESVFSESSREKVIASYFFKFTVNDSSAANFTVNGKSYVLNFNSFVILIRILTDASDSKEGVFVISASNPAPVASDQKTNSSKTESRASPLSAVIGQISFLKSTPNYYILCPNQMLCQETFGSFFNEINEIPQQIILSYSGDWKLKFVFKGLAEAGNSQKGTNEITVDRILRKQVLSSVEFYKFFDQKIFKSTKPVGIKIVKTKLVDSTSKENAGGNPQSPCFSINSETEIRQFLNSLDKIDLDYVNHLAFLLTDQATWEQADYGLKFIPLLKIKSTSCGDCDGKQVSKISSSSDQIQPCSGYIFITELPSKVKYSVGYDESGPRVTEVESPNFY